MDLGALLPVLVGGLLTGLGGFLGQWWSGRQADAREVRDRDHEHLVWTRQLRYEAHIGFLNEFERMFAVAEHADAEGRRDEGAEPARDFLVPLYDRLTTLRAVSEQKTIDKAKAALDALRDYVFGGLPDAAVEYGRDRYLVAMRAEFGLDPIRTWEDEIYDEMEAARDELPGPNGPDAPR